MIVLRSKNNMLDKITARLDSEGIEDYDIANRIPSDSVSLKVDSEVKIYLPLDYEYSQYDIDNYIRGNFGSHLRTTTKQDRDLYVMSISGRLNENQVYSLIKYIIETNEFIVLL